MDHAGLLDPVSTMQLLLLMLLLPLSCSQYDDAHHDGPMDSIPSNAELMQSQTFTDMEKLMKNFRRYNSMIRPNYRDGPTIVNVSMTVKNIASFDVSNMEYKMTIFLVRQWMDHRLHLRRKWSGREGYIDIPNAAAAGYLWRPTVFFNNEKNSVVHSVTAPNTILKVYNDSRVLYSMRITLTLSCPMYIRNYPWDIQFCPMTLTSASYTANEMFLQWDKDEHRMIAKDISILPLVVENITLSDNCTYTEIIGKSTPGHKYNPNPVPQQVNQDVYRSGQWNRDQF